MKALYVGILTPGTTSRMRADTLRRLTSDTRWDLVDTDDGFRQAGRIWKTMAFRTQSGPLVRQLNRRVADLTVDTHYDLIWIDKGVYLWPAVVEQLRGKGKCLVHFTPDTAFHANRSRHFFASAHLYDLLITTKSFELDQYARIADPKRIYQCTQAYDSELLGQIAPGNERNRAAVFIGLCEPDRERCIAALLGEKVPVRLGGRGWERFIKRNSAASGLHYLGREVFGDRYVSEYASASVGLGLLSKRFPELHTTRTFEIPAFGALLATERTTETTRFFAPDEALFFRNYDALAAQLAKLLRNPEKIRSMSRKGQQRVLTGGYDYASVLSGVLRHLSLVP